MRGGVRGHPPPPAPPPQGERGDGRRLRPVRRPRSGGVKPPAGTAIVLRTPSVGFGGIGRPPDRGREAPGWLRQSSLRDSNGSVPRIFAASDGTAAPPGARQPAKAG